MRRVEMIMGTAITIEVRSSSLPMATLHDHVAAAYAWFREVDQRFSTYKPDSEVSRLGAGALRIEAAAADTRLVLDRCEALRVATAGYFDAYASGRLDPSGFVKGWSVQEASDRLVAAGIGDHFINAGGDIRVRGTGPDGRPWRIGIAHPWERTKVAWVVEGADLAIATSGTYERGPHVLDPFTGAPAGVLASVTVTGPDLGVADAYATAAVAMGGRGLDWLAGLDGYESAAITKARAAYRSAGFPAVPVISVDDAGVPPY